MKVCLLYHTHEIIDDFGTHDDEKLIGVFSSLKKANEVIDKYKNLEGFRDCPLTCFTIDEYEVDKTFNWAEGFCTVTWTEWFSKWRWQIFEIFEIYHQYNFQFVEQIASPAEPVNGK